MATGADQKYILAVSAIELVLVLPMTALALPMLCRCSRGGMSHEAPGLLTSGTYPVLVRRASVCVLPPPPSLLLGTADPAPLHAVPLPPPSPPPLGSISGS